METKRIFVALVAGFTLIKSVRTGWHYFSSTMSMPMLALWVTLMTTTLDLLAKDKALRLAMLLVMVNAANPDWANPAIWAPFVIVGEPGSERRDALNLPQHTPSGEHTQWLDFVTLERGTAELKMDFLIPKRMPAVPVEESKSDFLLPLVPMASHSSINHLCSVLASLLRA